MVVARCSIVIKRNREAADKCVYAAMLPRTHKQGGEAMKAKSEQELWQDACELYDDGLLRVDGDETGGRRARDEDDPALLEDDELADVLSVEEFLAEFPAPDEDPSQEYARWRDATLALAKAG
jgi:hypothetical protein